MQLRAKQIQILRINYFQVVWVKNIQKCRCIFRPDITHKWGQALPKNVLKSCLHISKNACTSIGQSLLTLGPSCLHILKSACMYVIFKSTCTSQCMHVCFVNIFVLPMFQCLSNIYLCVDLGCSVIDTWPLTRAIQDSLQVPHTHDRPLSQVSLTANWFIEAASHLIEEYVQEYTEYKM